VQLQQRSGFHGTWISEGIIPIEAGYTTQMIPIIELQVFENDSVFISGRIEYSGRDIEGSILTSAMSGKIFPILEFRLDKKYINAKIYDYPISVIKGSTIGSEIFLDLREYLMDSRARQILNDPDAYSVSQYIIDINNNLEHFNSVCFKKNLTVN
jgi:hypothetical protein